ncbi:hypothetical protein GCM10010918_24470 [Paenibacillus radicis (ex Gao et al. 2016)]|uniref:Uncharacterized protein n=1 Tax=Paenibacillus radicis (ex Gao et al. 2016) TaxID=1737354 RepID=A0A917H5Y0_9BACL|nr:hypothetical protein GCM10010918_24470 [Paenibacillus radicis (ex Gao et al. 2016)]
MLEVVDVNVDLSLHLNTGMVHKNNNEAATGTLSSYRLNSLCGISIIV